MKHPRSFLLLTLTLVIVITTVILFGIESKRRALKEDFIELSKAKYGIFNVDEWKVIIADIIAKKVDEFDLTPTNREAMRGKIQAFLYRIMDESEANFNQDKSGSVFGFIQKSVASVTDIFGHLRSEVPKITEDILTFMDDPENRNEVKKYLQNLIHQYADNTFASVDYATMESVLSVHGVETKEEGLLTIEAKLALLNDKSFWYEWILAGAFLIVLIVLLFGSGLNQFELVMGLLMSLSLLIAGVLMPMIDIDARISTFNFRVLGEPVSFTNQVLYFKSKSILEVVRLMMSQGQLNIFVVGFLVLTFSVLFPLTKLITSVIWLFNQSSREKKWIQFFVIKSGKWSMADVMVVAIFMSYIGFSSILAEQLKQLENVGKTLEILTTNESTLNTGFYFFTAFVIVSLLVSNRLISKS